MESNVKDSVILKNRKTNKKSSMKTLAKKEKIEGLLFMAPFIILVSIFFIGPLFVAFMLSFKEYSFLDANSMFQAKWVGLNNYISVLKNETFLKALKNTTKYTLGVVPIQLIIALLLAIVVNGKIKGKSFFRTVYYIPTQTSAVAVSVIFLFLFKQDGVINKITSIFGIKSYNFLSEPKFALPVIMAMAVWSSVGLYMVIFLAGLQDIPDSLYEAADMDGANSWQLFRYITLPMLKPTVFFNLVVSMIGCFQVYDQAYVVSQGTGGPLDSTMTVVLYLTRTGFREFKMGEACAVAFILFLIIFALTVIQRKLFGEETSM
ncbi:carbohydrate ABC transporter membrane protein 1, CUT1 family [Clostridium sp. USBA 49]|jgi:multiple sugar transport system permease protein|uniref:carbohydrate ABC transporter permease n=1 Tax=Clostridium TaxID=1485 RepID=UPI0009CF3957|nr:MULTISPECIES: sugar ABC transporter permease [Clostridium]SKA78147.1 carbohydrate ABC transporter membrane protein 1, CUT1 family [Clostridium sp. USBA 49]